MVYLSEFFFPGIEREYDFKMGLKMTCYNTVYPYGILSKNSLKKLSFEPVTILYGGNGSGKTTALNVMAEKLRIDRTSLYNRSNFFDNYLEDCEYDIVAEIPKQSQIITSDDVFDYMLNVRCINDGVNNKREELVDEYTSYKNSSFRFKSLDDYEELKKRNDARSQTTSEYIRRNLADNIRERSNGESAIVYFQDKIRENALYLLDEPENSLSPEKQLELISFIEDSVRYFGCQFIIATHSPFLLAMRGARIYDFDQNPVCVRKWTELKNVRQYFNFFKEHEDEFI